MPTVRLYARSGKSLTLDLPTFDYLGRWTVDRDGDLILSRQRLTRVLAELGDIHHAERLVPPLGYYPCRVFQRLESQTCEIVCYRESENHPLF